MLKGRKKTVLILVLALILVGCVVIPAFALLIHDTNVDFNVKFGDIPADAMEFSAVNNQTFSFLRAGDTHDILLPTRNLSPKPIQYSYQLTSSADNLASAVLVYFDDKFVGTLAEAINKPMSFMGEDNLLMPIEGDVADYLSHKLTFELHKGAQGSLVENSTCNISITLLASTINYRENILVSNLDEFSKAIDDINNSEGSYKTIRLAKEIVLDKNYTVTNYGCIDYYLGNIDFNGNAIELKRGIAPFVLDFKSSRKTIDSMNINGAIIVNGNNAVINLDSSVGNLSKAVQLINYDTLSAVAMLTEQASMVIGNGINAGKSVNLFGANSFYANATTNGISVIGGEFCAVSQGTLTANPTTVTLYDRIIIDGNIQNFKIIGTEDLQGRYNTIIEKNLQHLQRLTIENNSTEVDYDLFLPKAIPSINANIEWWSSNSNIMSTEGVCGDSVEGLVKLIATIRINNDIITKEFNYTILKQSNQMRFDYLVARIGEKELSALYDQTNPKGSTITLPIVKIGDPIDYRVMYSMRSLGLDSITYELSPVYTYLSMFGTPSTVHLTDNTFDEYAEVKIKGVFSNEKEKEYSAAIGIIIKRLDNVKLHEQIIEYIQGLANDINILQNILDTRATEGLAKEKGDFYLPSEYRGFDLAYSSTEALLSNITLVQDPITEKYNYKFSVSPEYFYKKDTTISFNLTIKIKGWVEGGLKTESLIQLKTPGAIHNDGAGIVDSSLFYSTRLQLIQQIRDSDGNLLQGIPAINQEIVTTEIADVLKNYILIADSKYLKTLLIVTGGLTYNNAMAKMAFETSEKLYYFNVNSLNEYHDGLSIFSNLSSFQVVNESELLTTSSSETREAKGNNLLNFAVNNYSNLSRLDLINVYITDASRLKLLNNLIYLDVSKNTNYSDIDWTMERVNNRLDYLNLCGTAYNHHESQGLLMSLYYRHNNSIGTESQIYYGDNIKFTTLVDEIGQEINFRLFSLAFEKKIINSPSYQLVNSISVKGSSYAIIWSVVNQEGANYASIDSNRKIVNNIYYTQKPSNRPMEEQFTLIGTVNYSVNEGGVIVNKSIERRVMMFAQYSS